MMPRSILVLLFATLMGVCVSAGAQTTHTVAMHKYKFIPAEITIKAGDSVKWLNKERRAYHNIWFRDLGEEATGEMFPKEFLVRTFDKPGTYPYVCEPHEEDYEMTGVVHVTE
jgi:plastocyanin